MNKIPKELSIHDVIDSYLSRIGKVYSPEFISKNMPFGTLVLISIEGERVKNITDIIDLCDRAGVILNTLTVSKNTSSTVLTLIIRTLNEHYSVFGIIIDDSITNAPSMEMVAGQISPEKDILGFSKQEDVSSRRMYLPHILHYSGIEKDLDMPYNEVLTYDTKALAVMMLVEHYSIDVTNKTVLVISDRLYEDHLLHTLKLKGADVIIVNDNNIESLIYNADIVISLLGRAIDVKNLFINNNGDLTDTYRAEHILIDGCNDNADFSYKATEKCASFIPYSENNSFETLVAFAMVINTINVIHVKYLRSIRMTSEKLNRCAIGAKSTAWLNKRRENKNGIE